MHANVGCVLVFLATGVTIIREAFLFWGLPPVLPLVTVAIAPACSVVSPKTENKSSIADAVLPL